MAKRPGPERKPKNEAIHRVVVEAIKDGRYLFHPHALKRLAERDVTQMDVKEALVAGRREKKKDQYDRVREQWKYAFRGPGIDRNDIRVVVVEHDVELIMIITVVPKDCRDEN